MIPFNRLRGGDTAATLLSCGLMVIGISLWVSAALGQQGAKPIEIPPVKPVLLDQPPPAFWLSPDFTTVEGGGFPVHFIVSGGDRPYGARYSITFPGLDRPAVYSSTEVRQFPGQRSWLVTLHLPATLPDITLCEVYAWAYLTEEAFIHEVNPDITLSEPLPVWSLNSPD